jgi:hypothetical protein
MRPARTTLFDPVRGQLSPLWGDRRQRGVLGTSPEWERNCVEDSIWPLQPSVRTGIDLAAVTLLALRLHGRASLAIPELAIGCCV